MRANDDRRHPLRDANPSNRPIRLSYKFQRLREQIRRAVLSGEFSTKLPGERELGRRFCANAKTVNKALRDLTSEGLLIRHIGRGTFVAPRDGDVQSFERRHRVCWLRPVVDDPGGRRARIVAAVDERLSRRGHVVETNAIAATDGRCVVGVMHWPTGSRSVTDGLLIDGSGVLSGQPAVLDDAFIAESYRRHVPTVTVGACSGHAKLNAVVPDYVEGGYRLAEHLARLGCDAIAVVYVGTPTREFELILSGCRTAARRFDTALREIALSSTAEREAMPLGAMLAAGSDAKDAAKVGVVCIGAPAMTAVRVFLAAANGDAKHVLACTAFLDPGDQTAESAGWSSYETDEQLLAEWATRLVLDVRPGLRPAEVFVPGRLMVRGFRGSEARGTPRLSDRCAANAEPLDAVVV